MLQFPCILKICILYNQFTCDLMKNGSNLGLFLLSSKNLSAFPGFKTFKNILIFCLTYLTYLLIVQTPEPPLAYNYHLCTLYIIYNFSMTSFNSLSILYVCGQKLYNITFIYTIQQNMAKEKLIKSIAPWSYDRQLHEAPAWSRNVNMFP